MLGFIFICFIIGVFVTALACGVPIHRPNHDAMRNRAIEYDRLHGRGRADS